MSTTSATRTLAVTLGHDPAPELTTDSRTLARAYLAHVLTNTDAAAPSSRLMRTRHLSSWSRSRYAAAVRSLSDRQHHIVTQRPDGTRHLHVTVPADQPAAPLLASSPRSITRDRVRLRIWTDSYGVAEWRDFLGELDALGALRPGVRLIIDLGEATQPHPWIVSAVRRAIAAGHLPMPDLESRSPAVASAWRRAIEGQG